MIVALLAFLASTPAGAQISAEQLLEDLGRGSTASSDAAGSVTSTASRTTLEGAVDPESYILGPGDLLEIAYTGRPNPTERVRVSPSGRVQLSPTGPIQVAGLSLKSAEDKLRGVLSRYYPQTKISVDLLEVRTFRVHVLGQVPIPGTHEMTAAQRVSELFERSRGPEGQLLKQTSRRNLKLRRASGQEMAVDLARFETLGDLQVNPFLEDGDVLFVPARRESVSVFGWVPRPGFIEYRAGDTIDDLIQLAGGLNAGADIANVELRRFDGANPEEATREILDLDAVGGDKICLPGDGIYIRSNPDWRREHLVEIGGEIRYPGVYAIQEGKETLRDLVQRAGGFTPDADSRATKVYRPNVFDRPEEDPEFQRLQHIPISEMSHEEYEYLKLRSRQREGLASATLSTALELVEGGEDLVLRSGDQVTVPRANLAVDVQGAVKSPGFVPYTASRTIEEYLNLAGGKSSKARTGGLRVIRQTTGEWVKADSKTLVDPGDTVWVPEKPDRSWWKISREAVAFLASVATVVVVIQSVNN